MRGKREVGESGAAMLEFVLVAGMTMLLLFAIVDFGFAMNAQLVIASAAREGARRAAIDGGASEQARRRIREHLALGRIDPDKAEITINPPKAGYGGTVTVFVSYQYPFITPMIRSLGGDSLRLKAGASSRSEKVR